MYVFELFCDLSFAEISIGESGTLKNLSLHKFVLIFKFVILFTHLQVLIFNSQQHYIFNLIIL